MSDNQWEPLTTGDAVLDAAVSGRKIEFRMGANSGWEAVTMPEMAGFNIETFGYEYRALIEPAQPAADAGPGGTVPPESVSDGELPGMWSHSDTASADEVRGPAIPPGYKPWGGGGCPDEVAQAHDAETHVILRDGSHLISMVGRGHWFNWRELGDRTIIAYRVEEPARAVEAPEDSTQSQDWAGMDGAVAWHLIDRHADNWNEAGKMMDAWLAANAARAVAPKAEQAPGMQALYDAAAKGFHVTSTNGADSRYEHISSFRSIEDLQAYGRAFYAAMSSPPSATAPKADARTLCESCAGPTVRRTCENCGGNFWMSASKTGARAEPALSLDSQREMADAWSAVFNTLTEVMPSWLRERRCARDCAVAAIREMAAGSAPAEPAEDEPCPILAWCMDRELFGDGRGDPYYPDNIVAALTEYEAALVAAAEIAHREGARLYSAAEIKAEVQRERALAYEEGRKAAEARLAREAADPAEVEALAEVGEMDLTAPEKIWLQVDTGGDSEDRSEPIPRYCWDNLTWSAERMGGQEVTYIREDIARRLRPVVVDEAMVERAAKQVYALMPYDGEGEKPAWVDRGNSLKQDEARRYARAALTAALNPEGRSDG